MHSGGFDGVIGMEHGNMANGADGEKQVLAAFVAADRFKLMLALPESTTSFLQMIRFCCDKVRKRPYFLDRLGACESHSLVQRNR